MSINSLMVQKDKYIDGIASTAEKEIVSAYKASLKNIDAEIAKLFKAVGDNEMSLVEASKFNRLAKLKANVADELRKLGVTTRIVTTNASTTATKEAFYRTAYALESSAQMKLSFSVLPTDTVKKVVQNPISGLTLSETLAKNRAGVVLDIQRAMMQGIIQGESYPKMAKRIKTTLEGDASKAIRVVRTEVHRVNNEATIDAGLHAQAKGLEMQKMWVASLDSRTRDAHADLDGVTIPIDASFTSSNGGVGLAPGSLGSAADDVNCRCTLVYTFPDTVLDTRRDNEGLIPYTTYRDWEKNRLSGKPAKPAT